MDYTGKSRTELIELCKQKGIRGYSGKKKEELIVLLGSVSPSAEAGAKVCRLNYIGSKFQLLDWLTANILEKTGWSSLAGKRAGDLFAGTGIVSHHFRGLGCPVVSNDAELYSSVIAHAFTQSVCRPEVLAGLQTEIDDKKYTETVGFVTTHYSPYNGSERQFFTVDNARRIDYIRRRLEDLNSGMTDDDYKFALASLLISADAVSNVPAVYGCYLKSFKDKAIKPLTLTPIHGVVTPPSSGSTTYHSDVLALSAEIETDFVYLDPPYNERQYSKNYFPLNIIAKTPTVLQTEPALKGKTGIPTDCFISPFCKRGLAETAFETLFRDLKTTWIFLSYNSESIVAKDTMLELMGKYGVASVVERDYKRFKSFEYNQDVAIKEYLFCLRKTTG
jgi:adenine-specific DNA-methyltransferase